MVKYRDIHSVRLQFHYISLRHASSRCVTQMITLVVATARLTILDRLVIYMMCMTSEVMMNVLSNEITLLRRGIYVKCQAFARQRTGHSRRCRMT